MKVFIHFLYNVFYYKPSHSQVNSSCFTYITLPSFLPFSKSHDTYICIWTDVNINIATISLYLESFTIDTY